MIARSDIFAEDLEGLLEARDELAHVAKQLVLVCESAVHLALQVFHELVGLGGRLLLKVLQKGACHVSALREHVV